MRLSPLTSTRRVLGSATALVVVASTLLAVSAGSAQADPGLTTLPGGPASSRPAATGHRLADSYLAAPSAKSKWPVGSRTGKLAPEEGVTPQGDPSQNFASVKVAQKRAASTIQADIKLDAAPTLATNTRLRVAFGRIVSDGEGNKTCTPTAKSFFDINSFDVNGTGTTRNPAYDGKHVVVKPFKLGLARNANWSCAYALTLNDDATVLYDAFIGGLVDHIQKPRLSFVVKNKQLKGRGFNRVPIKIRNSASTIATAPGVRLVWKTKGVAVRANKRVGKIKPGASKKGAFYVKDTRRGNGTIVFTAISQGYRKSIRLTVREVR